MPQPLTITFSLALAEKVRIRAAAQGYANETEFVEDHLAEAVREDFELEVWLNTVAVSRYDAYDANPGDVLTESQLFKALAERRNSKIQTK